MLIVSDSKALPTKIFLEHYMVVNDEIYRWIEIDDEAHGLAILDVPVEFWESESIVVTEMIRLIDEGKIKKGPKGPHANSAHPDQITVRARAF